MSRCQTSHNEVLFTQNGEYGDGMTRCAESLISQVRWQNYSINKPTTWLAATKKMAIPSLCRLDCEKCVWELGRWSAVEVD